jgi:hypothetical protein
MRKTQGLLILAGLVLALGSGVGAFCFEGDYYAWGSFAGMMLVLLAVWRAGERARGAWYQALLNAEGGGVQYSTEGYGDEALEAVVDAIQESRYELALNLDMFCKFEIVVLRNGKRVFNVESSSWDGLLDAAMKEWRSDL